jgi:hypothetical protein
MAEKKSTPAAKKATTTVKPAAPAKAPVAKKAAVKPAAAAKKATVISAPAAKKAAAPKAVAPKAAAPKAAAKRKGAGPTPEERYRMIAEAAYYIAEQRGFTPGDPAKDWRDAEAQIASQVGK